MICTICAETYSDEIKANIWDYGYRLRERRSIKETNVDAASNACIYALMHKYKNRYIHMHLRTVTHTHT